MTTQFPPGPVSGPYVYPGAPTRPTPRTRRTATPSNPPPADRARATSPGAGKIVALLAGAGVVALMAGTVGGAVGYVVARETLPQTAASSAGLLPGSPSAVPGSIADIAARVQPAVVQLNVTDSAGGGTGSGFVISEDG